MSKNEDKKVFIGVGHGGSDPGAVGYVKEADVNLIMAEGCRDYLVSKGVTVLMSRTRDENDPVSQEVNECNAFNPDLAVDIHNNAGGGDGFEAIVSINGGVGRTLAENIEVEVKKIGQNSRGIKTRKNSSGKDYFAFIRSIECPSVILEGLFVDNAKDVQIGDTIAEQRAFGVAYAKGILKTLNVADKAPSKPKVETKPVESSSFKVRVKIKDLNIRAGAGTNFERKGFIKPGVYTIVDVKNGFGKLKSGAGWISLNYAERI